MSPRCKPYTPFTQKFGHSQEFELSGKLSILPVTALKDGPFKSMMVGANRGLRNDIGMSLNILGLPESALVYPLELRDTIAPFSASGLPPSPQREAARRIEAHMQEITDFLTVIGPRIAISASITFEFDNEDLHYFASNFQGQRYRFIEVLPILPAFANPALDIDEARELAGIFLQLPDDPKKQLRVALNRLSLAQRRLQLGDKAIDLAIALESLLGGKENNEVAHKVTTRATRLLGGSDDKRRFNHGVVSATYSYRSKMVHNGEPPSKDKPIDGKKMEPKQIISATVDICVEVIKKIIRLRKIPEWTEFDILEKTDA